MHSDELALAGKRRQLAEVRRRLAVIRAELDREQEREAELAGSVRVLEAIARCDRMTQN